MALPAGGRFDETHATFRIVVGLDRATVPIPKNKISAVKDKKKSRSKRRRHTNQADYSPDTSGSVGQPM